MLGDVLKISLFEGLEIRMEEVVGS